MGRGLLIIGDPQTAAEIEIADRDPLFPKPPDQILQPPEGVDEGRDLRHLRTDMAAHPLDVQMRERCRTPVGNEGGLDVDPEFVLLETGGDMGMGLGIDIRVDPKGNPRPDAQHVPRGR